MKKVAFFIVNFSLLLMLLGCSGSGTVSQALEAADSLVCISPDSARSAVRMLDSLDLRGANDEQRAHYALLLTKAREKAYIGVTDDSLINVAVDYYRGRGDSLETQSLYYQGAILNRRGDYSDALIPLMEAADLATETGDDFYLGMAARVQAEIYAQLLEFDQAVRFYQQAVDAFNRAKRPQHAAWERIYIPQTLIHSGKTADAYDSIRVLATDSIIGSDPAIQKEFFFIACNVAFENKDFEQSEKYFKAMTAAGRIPESKLLSQMAKVKLRLGDQEEALKQGEKALGVAKDRTDTAAYQVFMADFYENTGNLDEAYSYYRKSQNDHIKRVNSLITHPYTAKTSDYYHKSNNDNKLKKETAEQHNILLAFILLILTLVIVLLYFLHKKNLRQKKLETQLLLADLEKLRAELAATSKATKHLIDNKHPEINDSDSGPKLTTFPGSRLLNRICEAHYLMMPGDEGYKRFGKHTAEIVNTLDSDDFFRELEDFVNSTNDKIMSGFREQFPDSPEKHYKVAVLTFAGFSTSSILNITKLKEGSYRNMRSKIRTAILASDCQERDLYLKYFASQKSK